jgi:hypothetical protein
MSEMVHLWAHLQRLEQWSRDATHDVAEAIRHVDCVREALIKSRPIAVDLIRKNFPEIDFSSVASFFLAAIEEIAVFYGGSVVLCTAGGAVIGAIAGEGVGAIPGAIAGFGVGQEVGAWVMGILGVKALAEYVTRSVPLALDYYKQGFGLAWGPIVDRSGQMLSVDGKEYRGPPQTPAIRIWHAANLIAEGHVLLLGAILMGFVAYVTRGRGDKAAVLQEIRNSRRLGPKVAEWFEKNEDRLVRNPKLHPRPTRAGGEPEELPGRAKTREREQARDREKPSEMPEAKVPCFQPNDLPQSKIPEFDRQLDGQERGLNEMTVEEYLQGREAFENKTVSRDPGVARQARAEYEAALGRMRARALIGQGLPPAAAKAQAAREAKDVMKALAALHNPDMVTGGEDKIGDFGDRNVNSRIGRQWKDRIRWLDAQARKIPEAVRQTVKLNARLVRCK